MKEKIPKTFWPSGNGQEQGLEKWSVACLFQARHQCRPPLEKAHFFYVSFILRDLSLRMYPQDNDTGGFFVTVLEKAADDNASSAAESNEKEQRIASEPT